MGTTKKGTTKGHARYQQYIYTPALRHQQCYLMVALNSAAVPVRSAVQLTTAAGPAPPWSVGCVSDGLPQTPDPRPGRPKPPGAAPPFGAARELRTHCARQTSSKEQWLPCGVAAAGPVLTPTQLAPLLRRRQPLWGCQELPRPRWGGLWRCPWRGRWAAARLAGTTTAAAGQAAEAPPQPTVRRGRRMQRPVRRRRRPRPFRPHAHVGVCPGPGPAAARRRRAPRP